MRLYLNPANIACCKVKSVRLLQKEINLKKICKFVPTAYCKNLRFYLFFEKFWIIFRNENTCKPQVAFETNAFKRNNFGF